MTGFAWCRTSFIKANLAGGKATQLTNESRELMDLLHGRMWWAHSMIMQYPHLPAIMLPDVPTSYRFIKFDREFEFKYYADDDVWLLTFIGFITPPPKKTRSNGKNGSNNAPKRNRRWRPGDTSTRASLREVWEDAKPLIAESRQWLAARRRRVLAGIQLCRGWVEHAYAHALDRIRDRAGAMERMLRLKLEAIRRDFAAAHAVDVFAEAHLERRLVQIAPGLSVMLSTFVSERLPWESWLFGRLLEEEVLLN